MEELELLKIMVGTSGSSIIGIFALAYLFYRESKKSKTQENILVQLLKADQMTREKHTEVLTKLNSTIDEFNRLNSTNQRQCLEIREAMTQEVTRLAELK